MGAVLHLTAPAMSLATIAALEYLLLEARAGRVVGLAYVAMHRGYAYSVDIAGETWKVPTLTRGMLHVLDDQLAHIIAQHLPGPRGT